MPEAAEQTRERRVELQKWALIAEIAGGLAVVVSVVYLAIQISDNNRLLRSQAHYNALDLGMRPLEIMVENETLAGIVVQCDATPEEVAARDWERCRNYYFMEYNSWEYMYYQNIDGSIPGELWGGADAYFRNELRQKEGHVRFWKEMAVGFDEPFKSYVSEQFTERGAKSD